MTRAADLLTPEEVAEQLGLHVKTVRRYIREGQLPAVRVGKRYRVTREALEAFAGLSPRASASAAVRPFTEASSIVSIEALSREDAERLTTLLVASARSRRDESEPLRVQTLYHPEKRRLKVVCHGDLASTISLLALANSLLENGA